MGQSEARGPNASRRSWRLSRSGGYDEAMAHPLGDSCPRPTAPGKRRFATTRWSLVLAAADPAAPYSREALAELCAAYWYPVYSYIRRRGHDAHRAEDLTQQFFTRLLEKRFLAGVERGKGRFRSFLLTCVSRLLANDWEHGAALKRGGGRPLVSIDAADADRRYRLEPAQGQTAEAIFAKRWALELLDRAIVRLEGDFRDAGKGRLFGDLKGYLQGDRGLSPYSEVAAAHGMTEGAIKAAVFRLRHRFGLVLREEVARTVDDPAEVEDELRGLLLALGT